MKKDAGVILKTYDDKLLLQLRDDTPEIANPGKIAIFGGIKEPNESFEDCAVREIAEEVGLKINKEDLKLIGVYNANIENVGSVESYIFLADSIRQKDASLNEGRAIFTLHPGDNMESLNLTYVCRLALIDYFTKII